MPPRISAAVSRLCDLPIAALPFSLVCINQGVMWHAFGRAGFFGMAIETASGLDTVRDVFAWLSILVQLLFTAKVLVIAFSSGPRELYCRASATQAAPPCAAGLMATMAIAAWAHDRGALAFGVALWTSSLVAFFVAFCSFAVGLWHKMHELHEAPPPSGTGSSRGSACCVTIRAQRLWSASSPAWLLPLVGIAAAPATGGTLIRWASPALAAPRILALYGPLALSAVWAVLMLPLLWARVLHMRALFHNPQSAILMAPLSLIFVGYISAIDDEFPDVRDSPLTTALITIAFVSDIPVTVALPCLLDPRKPFSYGIASCGFPTEIAAIALVRYRMIIAHWPAIGQGVLLFWQLAAWCALVLSTLSTAVIILRFATAASLGHGRELLVRETQRRKRGTGPHEGSRANDTNTTASNTVSCIASEQENHEENLLAEART